MSRSASPALKAHLAQPVTTTCRLLKIQTNDSPPLVLGFTTLDQPVVYDDGDGEVVYSAVAGFDPSTIRSDVGYSVDNAEANALISDDISPSLSKEDIDAGKLDDSTWVCYVVNWKDLSMGHLILDAGDVGQVRTRYGMAWFPELLSHTVRFRQPVGHVDSKTCRAEFGTPAASQTGCGVNADALWVNGVVTSVIESDMVFNADISSGLIVNPVPGRVQWLTGDNAGKTFWTEDVDGSLVSLGEATGYDIQIGDEFRIRPDCKKLYLEWCIGVYDNGLNFKGEPLIPVGDASQIMTPGAQLPGGGAYSGSSQSDDA